MIKEDAATTKANLTPAKDHILESKSGEIASFNKPQEINKTPSEVMQPPNPLPVKSYDISYANITSQ